MAIVSETGFVDFGKDKLFVKHIHRDNGVGDQPVLFVHGVTYSSHVFDLNFEDYSLARVVAENGCSVWLLDLPGYANSMTAKNGFDVTVDYAALAINATVDYILSEENVEKISLFGWSMGTVTGSAFAVAFPQKVRKLILFAPIFTGLNIPTKLDSIHVNTPEHAAEDFQKLPNGTNDDSITDPNLIKAFVDQCMFFDGHGSPNGPRLKLLGYEQLIAMDRIDCPLLVVAGTRDPYLNRPFFDTRRLQKHPNERFVLFEGAGHTVLFEKPYYRAFQKTVVEFLT